MKTIKKGGLLVLANAPIVALSNSALSFSYPTENERVKKFTSTTICVDVIMYVSWQTKFDSSLQHVKEYLYRPRCRQALEARRKRVMIIKLVA